MDYSLKPRLSMTALLYAIFFASGVSALIFETLWFRQAGLALGNSVWASSLVLAGFMGGLALGNAAAARYGERVPNPVRAYALAEVGIAFTGVGLVYLFPVLGTALAPWLRPLLDHPWVLNPLRLAIAFALLLIPSAAMGITLPLLTRALIGHDPQFGPVLGRLYGWNTLGAVIGVVVSETYLVGAHGVRGTALVAGTMNMAAAAVAFFVGRAFATHPAGIEAGPPPRTSPPHRASVRDGDPGPARWGANGPPYEDRGAAIFVGRAFTARQSSGTPWLAAAFLSGFCLLALEVVWFRFLLLFVKGHSVALALMLGTVLAGIALGGLAASSWLRVVRGADRFSATIAFAAGLGCVMSYAAFPSIVDSAPSLISDAFGILRISAPLMLPVSFLSGILFTLLGSTLRNYLTSETETSGILTLANTAGAASGSLVAGFALLPILGIETSFFLIAALYGGIGVLLAGATHASPRRNAAPRGMASASAAVLLAGIALFPFGAMETRLLEAAVRPWRQADADARVVAVREGLTETVIYFERAMMGRPLSYAMLTNSFSMSATNYGARRYMKLYVYWPMAVHPNLKHALLIGYGVGNTAKALTDSRSLETIDVVDLSRDILDMNRLVYPSEADSPLHDPRVRVHVEDGRYFLQTTDRRFDLITGEPPPPGIAGVEHLYTREYFQLIHERLAEGGIVTYWLPLSDLTDVSTNAILGAFCGVFDDCSLWNGSGTHLMLVGTRNAGAATREAFVRQWGDPIVAPEMRRLGFEQPEQLGALFIGDADYLRRLTGASLPLTDNYPKLIEAPFSSREGPDRLFRSFTDTATARGRFENSGFIKRTWPGPLIAASLPYFEFQDTINAHLYGNLIERPGAIEEVHRLLTRSSLSAPALWRLGSNADIQRVVASARPEESTNPLLQFHLGVGLISDRKYAAAAEALRLAAELASSVTTPGVASTGENAFALYVYALCMSGQTRQAQEIIRGPWEQSLRDRGVRAESSTDAALPSYWLWMKETFGIDPRLVGSR